MKKRLFGILTVALVVLLALTSCNPEVNAYSDELVSIQFDNAVSKSLESYINYVDFEDIYWTYTAVKTDNLGQKGSTTAETPVNDGTGLSGTIGGFSQGKWQFTLNGYLEAEHTNLLYVGVPTAAKLVKSDNPTAIPVTVKLNAEGDGTVKLNDIAFDFDATADVTVIIKSGDTDIYSGVIKAADGYTLNDEFDLAAGSYAFDVLYSCVSGGDAYLLATSSVNVRVVAGMTTVISGSLDEDTCDITFQTDASEAIKVAVLHSDNGMTGYASLAEAVAQALEGETIIILQDVSVDETLNISKSLTLELGARTITSTAAGNAISISNGAVLTINGISAGGIAADGTIIYINGCGVVINGGTLKSNTTAIICEKGSVEIFGGSIESSSATEPAINVSGDSSIAVTSGAVKSASDLALVVENASALFNGDTEFQGKVAITGSTVEFSSSLSVVPQGSVGETNTVVCNTDLDLSELVASGIELKTGVARTGETYFATLAAAVEAAQDGVNTEIIILEDITVEGNTGIAIPASKKIALDLNGHVLTNKVTEAKASNFITVSGELTVSDSSLSQNGLITTTGLTSDQAGSPGSGRNYVNNVITNRGKFVLESGNIASGIKGSSCYAIDTAAGTTTIINGGKITAAGRTTMRIVLGFSGNEKAVFTMNGGVIEGDYAGIWIHLPSSTGNVPLDFTVNGGSILALDPTEAYSFYDYSYGQTFDNVNYTINGGTFAGYIYSYGKSMQVNGGTFYNEIYCEDGSKYVKGGTFINENLCIEDISLADGYSIVPQEDGKTFIVKADSELTRDEAIAVGFEAEIDGTFYKTLSKAANAAQNGDTIVLLNDVANSGSVSLKNGVALDGQSKKISGETRIFMGADTTIMNVHFKDIAKEGGNFSAVHAESSTGSHVVKDCIFENIQYESLQLIPADEEASYTITGNSFINGGSRRNIHIQSSNSLAFSVVIKDNSFTEIAVSDTPIEVYCVADTDKIEISGNYVEMEHPEVCILDKTAAGYVNVGPYVAVNGFVDENGNDIVFKGAVALSNDKTTFYEDTTGTSCKVFFINSVEDLKALNGLQSSGKTYILTTDLDLEDQAWTPITGSTSQFTGTFDGAGHTISNLNAETKTPKASGLFGEVVGTIKNLTVVNATVKGNDYVGVIVGKMWGDVTNCKVYNATVTANPFLKEVGGTEYDGGAKAGAIIGYGADGGNRSNNYVENATINAYRDLGGIAGYAQGTSLLRYSTVKNVSLNYIQIPEGFTYDGNTPNQNMGDFAGRYDAGLDTTGSVVLD